MKKPNRKPKKKKPRGRPLTEVGKLAAKEGISPQLAWYRLRRRTGRPVGRPKLLANLDEVV